MFCSKCGTKQGAGEKFCPKCGNPFTENPNANENKVSIVDNLKAKADEVANYAKGPLAEKVKTTVEQACVAAEPMAKKVAEQVKSTVDQIQSELKDENNNSDIADNQSVVKGKWNIKKILWGIVSFFIPLVGLIFFFVKKKDNLPMAKFALCCAAVGFIFNTINYWGGESDDYEDEYYESSSTNNYNSSSSSSMSSNSISANFRSETDVRTFLCRYTFRDNEGNRISFSNMANQLEMNGRAMSSSLTIQRFGRDEAELVFQGPYGRSRFYLAVEDGEAGLMDRNDLSTYYAK